MAQGLKGDEGMVVGATLHVLLPSGKAAEGQAEGTSRKASEHWKASDTSGWISYHEGQGEICS